MHSETRMPLLIAALYGIVSVRMVAERSRFEPVESPSERMQNCTGCICSTFLQCAFWYLHDFGINMVQVIVQQGVREKQV